MTRTSEAEVEAERVIDTNAVVYGVHWTPAPARDAPANLDAMCELRDRNGISLEVIGPERLSSSNGSVVHTGDSRTGASPWDDERVFVFLDALPAHVQQVEFRVTSRDGRKLCEVPGASCHLSDYRTEDALLIVELAVIPAGAEYLFATLQRCATGWSLHAR